MYPQNIKMDIETVLNKAKRHCCWNYLTGNTCKTRGEIYESRRCHNCGKGWCRECTKSKQYQPFSCGECEEQSNARTFNHSLCMECNDKLKKYRVSIGKSKNLMVGILLMPIAINTIQPILRYARNMYHPSTK